MPALRLDFNDAVATLVRGGVLILPTDTLPGIHCRADLQESVVRVAGMKGRDDGKPLLVLAGSLDQARGVCAPWSDEQTTICQECWPGPFSLILPVGPLPAERVTATGGTVAIRVPRHPDLRKLILSVGFPLVSTSANMQGEKPVQVMAEAVELFTGQADGWWAPADTPKAEGKPSALVDLTGSEPRVLRPGPEAGPF